jgi:SAM-dependent MidA family methyltransferase
MADRTRALMERLDHFMARANAAYYATHDPFRSFTTSPEISQAFGEILGLWAAVMWKMLGRPDPVLLVEAGPGRGTLMADALRAIGSVAGPFRAALRLHFIEASPRLQAVQAERITGATWHSSLETLPDAPFLLLANEFVDALPIRQFVYRGGLWLERFVQDGRFVECPSNFVLPRSGPAGEDRRGENPIVEVNEPAIAFTRALGTRLSVRPGAALIVDYGPERTTPGDSLQALGRSGPADPLACPGSADLTAHVDFAGLATTAREAGATAYGPVPQGLFLARLGLFQRTDRLAGGLPPAQASRLIEAARRLAEPNRMGRLFKALALCSPGGAAPPGFET